MFERRPRMQRIIRCGFLGKNISHYTSLFSVLYLWHYIRNLCRNSVYEIVASFFLTGIEYEDQDVTGDDDDDDDDDYETDTWLICHNNFHGYPRLSERSDRELSGKRTTSSSRLCRSPRCTYNGCEHHHLSPSIPVQEQESVSYFCHVSSISDGVNRRSVSFTTPAILFFFFFRILKEKPDYYKRWKKANKRLRRSDLRNR